MLASINIDALPVELLDKIFGLLSQPAPSTAKLCNQPDISITQSNTTDLKAVSNVSARWRQAILSELFRYTRVIIRSDQRDFASGWPAEYQDFLAFVGRNDLGRSVESFTLLVEESPTLDHDNTVDYSDPVQNRWEGLFRIVNPTRLTIVAPPPLLGLLTAIPVSIDVRPYFHMPYCILSLGLSVPRGAVASSEQSITPASPPTLLSSRPWDSLLLNEGSFVRAYSDPSYPHNTADPPSLLSALAAVSATAPLAPTIRSLAYIAIFPFAAHVAQIHGFLAQLSRFEIQLLPRGDLQPDPLQMGMAEPLAMEFRRDLVYNELLRYVLDSRVGNEPCLEEIVCHDVAVDATAWKTAVVTQLSVEPERWSEDPDREGVFVRTKQ